MSTNKSKQSKTKPNRHKSLCYSGLELPEEELHNMCFESYIPLPKLSKSEAEFLKLVARGNIAAVQKYLQDNSELNINCVDFQDTSALHIVVRNQSEEMVEFLLNLAHIEIGDNVLHAVRNNSINILVMLLEAQKKISPGLEFAGSTHSAAFPEHVTPLILAAQSGHYEVVALLIARGHTIHRPHPPDCFCVNCTNFVDNEDPLHASIARLSVYRAISSPEYLIQICSDPILAAFPLTAELAASAAANRQITAAYIQLMNDVSAFAVDLIGCCRTSEEVELVLKQPAGTRGHPHFVLPRLLMAVDYKQKEFVAHPNTQQVLESYWLGDWYSWKTKSTLRKSLIILSRNFITPIILILCVVAPRCWLVRHFQIPLNKLITHAAAYFVFLTLVFYISNQDKTEQKRGPPTTGVEAPLVLYVCGYTWSAIRMCLMQGPRRYFTNMWNWANIIMLFLFILTFSFWISAAVEVSISYDGIERKYWNTHDPTLLAEGTFCLATLLAFFQLMSFCQLNYHLGPLQVSLGKMTIDIYKYIIVFAIIMSAFAAGLARLYQYYDGMVYEDESGVKTVQVSSFTSLPDTLKTLFWALFCMAPLESADVVLANTRDFRNTEKFQDNRHGFTELIGYFCFGCFEVISVIVVLNMLIATMSNTFQKVNDNVATEWTFGRTEMYIHYMSQTTLPSPFNMIPTAAAMSNVIEWLRTKMTKCPGVRAKWAPSHCCYMDRDIEEAQNEFSALMAVLVQRYFSVKRERNRKEDLNAIRKDIASIKSIIEESDKD